MRKTFLTIVFLMAAVAFASPVKSRLASRECDFADKAEERNTDYIQVDPTFTGSAVGQNTGVLVGTGTDFSVGARMVFDITVERWEVSGQILFGNVSVGAGYGWLYLASKEPLSAGRYVVEYVNKVSSTISEPVRINGGYSAYSYTCWWQYKDTSHEVRIGNRTSSYGGYFRGLYHSISLYDSAGNLRHKWVPDPSGRFYDEIGGTFTTIVSGQFIYGDLSNE